MLLYDSWNINFTSAVNANNTNIIKTIYDPSVSDFCLPRTAACTNFTTSGANRAPSNANGSFNKGWNYYKNESTGETIFFEALGYRNSYSGDNGDILGVGSSVYFWLSGGADYRRAFSLEAYYSSTSPYRPNYFSYGFSVYPVKE